jgi:hypothetical protein
MRAWADTRALKLETGSLSSKAEALDWVTRHPMCSPSPWSEDGIEASLAVFPELLLSLVLGVIDLVFILCWVGVRMIRSKE